MDALEFMAKVGADADPENGLRILAGLAKRTCEGCGGCCGRFIPMTDRERARLLEYVRRHRVKPAANKRDMCALLDEGTCRCRAYPARPLVCRAWARPDEAELVGTRPGQPCGMRADMARPFWAHLGEYNHTDTWELFGIEED